MVPGSEKKIVGKNMAKNGTSTFGFDSGLKLKTDEKWSLKAKKKSFEVEN